MPFSPTGVYTPATGATTAVPGGLIQSAIWNGIFADITTALTQLGQQQYNTTVVSSSPYTVLATDTVLLVDTTGSAITLNLGAASARNGLTLKIKDYKGNAATNNITINRNGADTIDGLTSLVIRDNYGGFQINPITGGWFLSP